MKIAVVGATGRVGHHVANVLAELGHEVVRVARSVGIDVVAGTGLHEALEGVDAMIDAATGPSPDQEEATRFFTIAARNLHRAGTAAGVRQVVSVSIIGVDQFTSGYGVAKQRHEEAVLSGPIPARVVRAAQFHEFVPQLVSWGSNGGVATLQRTLAQPVAARSVAEALAEVAAARWETTAKPIMEIAGPREESLAELARLWVERNGDPLVINEVTNEADPDHALYESGALLPGPDAHRIGPTFQEWLDTTS